MAEELPIRPSRKTQNNQLQSINQPFGRLTICVWNCDIIVSYMHIGVFCLMPRRFFMHLGLKFFINIISLAILHQIL